MTPEERQQIETQIKSDFSEMQKNLEDLRKDVQNERDEAEKRKKEEELEKLEEQATKLKEMIDTISSLSDEQLQELNKKDLWSLKNDIIGLTQESNEELSEQSTKKIETPTTYELLKDSETYNRLCTIISSNPKEFANLPWDTPEKKLEYIFSKIRNSVGLFMKNKLWNSENAEKIINNTIAPAFERCMMELLKNQWNETNIGMLKWMDKISRESFNNLVNWVSEFARTTKWAFNKFSQWLNAIDYLSVHNWVLKNPEKSAVLTSPIEFKKYLNNTSFANENFSPYASIDADLFQIDENQSFEFGISLQEKQEILNQIWNIQVANNPKTTVLIAKMLDKPEKFLWATSTLQETANHLLDWINAINPVAQLFWTDILWEIGKAPEKRNFIFRIVDFVCKLIWITWWLEWIVKKWRLDRLNLTDEKNENISNIFKEYQKLAWDNVSLSITDENSCKIALNDFIVTDLDKTSSTKWDYLRDVIVDNMDINLISPDIIQQTLWNTFIKKEIITVDWKQQEKVSIDTTKFTEDDKKNLAHKHISNMYSHLVSNYSNLSDFYANINSTEDLALCIIASLYTNQDDVIEWVKAKIFLPENYGTTHSDWTILESWNGWKDSSVALIELSSEENSEMQNLVEQSKTPNTINYLENSTYKKYLNSIEHDLNLPRYALECVCMQESRWKLYKWNRILWSSAWAQWLFQFMPWTADKYMKNPRLLEKYWKTFNSRDKFLRDPLATAWAAWIMYSEFMYKYKYNFQSALACYNRWIWNYQKSIWKRNLTPWDLGKLPSETKNYVESISKNVLVHNSASSNDTLLADLWQYSRNNWWTDNVEYNKELLIWPKLLAHNKDEIWWLGNSIMSWFKWLNVKTNFPNMDGAAWKSTVTHPNRFNSQNDVLAYKNAHTNIKSFMFYFGVNTRDNNRTLSDIKQWSEWLEAEWIQPVLCTCIWEDKNIWLKDLNQELIHLWREKKWPVLDFAKSYSKWDIAMNTDWVHPISYSQMTDIINWQLSMA